MVDNMPTSKEVQVMLPTFIMAPGDDEKFRPSQVKYICDQVLKENIGENKYDDDDSIDMSTKIAEEIKKRVKELNIPRYKVVVQVALGEKREHSVRVSSRCLWSSETDNYASSNYSNEYMWGVAIVFGCYVE